MMNKKLVFIIILVFIISYVAADIAVDALWQKAQQIASDNWNLVPGRIEKEKKIFKKNGDIKVNKEVSINCSLIDNEITVQLIQARDGEKELTEDNKYVQREIKADYVPDNHSIFHNNDQYNVTFENTHETVDLDGKKCLIYQLEFTMLEEGKEVDYTGILWLDADSGIPYKLEQSCKKLPPTVKSFKETTHYTINQNGYWIKLSKITLMDVTVLFIKLKMEIKYDYSDYWVFPKN